MSPSRTCPPMFRKRPPLLHWLLAAALLLSQLGGWVHGLSHLRDAQRVPAGLVFQLHAAGADANEAGDKAPDGHAAQSCKQCLAWAALDAAVPAPAAVPLLAEAGPVLAAPALPDGHSRFRAAYRSRAPPRAAVSNA